MSAIQKELNEVQWTAVSYCNGPSLIVAGAGSGKTRVLTYKIAYLLEKGVDAWQILSLTFTNKAAREMNERIAQVMGTDAIRYIWSGTFHSIFSRILRQEAGIIGYTHDFTIYDQNDSRSLIKSIIKELGLDDKKYKPQVVAGRISEAKNALVLPSLYLKDNSVVERDRRDGISKTGEIYRIYMNRCKAADAMDFDDLLLNTFLLFQNNEEIKEKYKNRFKYILVDEYQDTNVAQHRIITQLTNPDSCICVVGDDAQSIYSFRGARIDNILGFQEQYPSAKLFKLERNYRSTQTIVNAADSLIKHNKYQISKNVFSEGEKGEPIKIIEAYSDKEESLKVVGEIIKLVRNKDLNYSDIAILYRTNAQSRSFEENLRKYNLPYRIYGGLSFYQRKEIKDLIAYFRLICNPADEEAFKRVINYPARGIGATTLSKIQVAAVEYGVTLWDVAESPSQYGVSISKAALGKIEAFLSLIVKFRNELHKKNGSNLAMDVLYETGINTEIIADTSADGISKKENIEELLGAIRANEEDSREENKKKIVPLTEYISKVSLLTDADSKDNGEPCITLMTVHAAKGLEFDAVFVTGMENDLFPNSNARYYPKEMEEERRLFYVAITRAKRFCYLSYAKNRFKFGKMEFGEPSVFLDEIDKKYVEWYTKYEMRTNNNGNLFSRQESYFSEKKNTKVPLNASTTNNTKLTKNFDNRSSFGVTDDKRFKKRIYSNGKILQQIISNGNNENAFVGSSVECCNTLFRVGDKVKHERFGFGTIMSLEGKESAAKAQIDFEKGVGVKKLLLKFAKLDIIK